MSDLVKRTLNRLLAKETAGKKSTMKGKPSSNNTEDFAGSPVETTVQSIADAFDFDSSSQIKVLPSKKKGGQEKLALLLPKTTSLDMESFKALNSMCDRVGIKYYDLEVNDNGTYTLELYG